MSHDTCGKCRFLKISDWSCKKKQGLFYVKPHHDGCSQWRYRRPSFTSYQETGIGIMPRCKSCIQFFRGRCLKNNIAVNEDQAACREYTAVRSEQEDQSGKAKT